MFCPCLLFVLSLFVRFCLCDFFYYFAGLIVFAVVCFCLFLFVFVYFNIIMQQGKGGGQNRMFFAVAFFVLARRVSGFIYMCTVATGIT